jgi:hypothetical protein
MGMFRRAKAQPKHGQRGILNMVTNRKKVRCDETSIGDDLSPDDQFDLYVPLKRPTGILKNRSFELVQRRQCIQLQRDRKDFSPTTNVEDLETSSAVSSLTTPSFTTKLSNEGTESALSGHKKKDETTANKQRSKSACVNSKSTWSNSCCGVSEQTEATDDTNSIVAAGRHKTRSSSQAKKPTTLSFWSTICAPRNEASYINDDHTASILLKRPVSLRKETSLFDTLQDEEADMWEMATEGGADTTIAVVEVDYTHDEEPSVVTTNSKWKLKFPTVRSLPKMRSIPKIRSFKLGKKKKKPKYVRPFDLD